MKYSIEEKVFFESPVGEIIQWMISRIQSIPYLSSGHKTQKALGIRR